MTERMPAGTTPGSWAEALIAEAMARGELEPRAGHGRPLDLSDADDPDWWLTRKLRDEDVVVLPPALQLRRDLDEVLAGLEDLPTPSAVREVLTALDRRIRRANSHGLDGPPSTLSPLDVERLVGEWRARHPDRRDRSPARRPIVAPEPVRRRWWQRRRRRRQIRTPPPNGR